MARIGKPALPAPTRTQRQAPPSKPIDALPAALRPHAAFADSKFGNDDGVLDRTELAKYAAAYGTLPGYGDSVFKPLEQALGESLDLKPSADPGPASNLALAAKLTKAGGTADQTDVDLVAAELARLPAAVLQKMDAAGVKVIAARGSVTDVCTELKGVRPRGWPPGATWDQVPGLYDPGRGAVVIATIERDGKRLVPPQGTLHGSYSLVLHETGHGIDYAKALESDDSQSAAFKAAYAADRAQLEADHETYLLQEGNAGLEEAYAESCGRYFAGDPAMAKDMPNLKAYWEGATQRARS